VTRQPAQSGEDALIAALAARLSVPRHTRLAIGDDAAAIALPGGELLLVTTDMLMEGVHFRTEWADPASLGWKALAQNVSDIAAMGGTPTHAVIALALPAGWAAERCAGVYDGLREMAEVAHVDVVGGDTIRSVGPLTLSITVLGRVAEGEMLTRAGARPGDAIYVTGTLGRAAAGLRLLQNGRPVPLDLGAAVEAQHRPQPRLAAGRALARSGVVSAMMDLSDGLATDLHRLCRASGVGAVVERGRLPVDPVVIAACDWLAMAGATPDPVDLALTGGEDFELLFTAPPDAEETLRVAIGDLPITCVGRITAGADVVLVGITGVAPLPWGFTHF
jgi:thiamine-monophosphate kinase